MSERKLTDAEIEKLLGGDGQPVQRELVKVKGVSGSEYLVFNKDEAKWFKDNLKRYQEEYRFDNISDLQDLDRMLGMELLSYRYQSWLSQGTDYEGLIFDEKAIRDHKQKTDQEIRLTKAAMGMARKARVESEQQSTGEYLRSLLRRAEEFGIHRDEQIAKAIDVLMETKKLIGLHDRCDEEERKHLGVEMEDIFMWLRDVAIPEYMEIDNAFRKNQVLWIKEVS
jgi:hypothetical protein